MTPLPVLIMVGVLAAAAEASAACRWFGTQLECNLGGHLRDLVSKVAQIVVDLRGDRSKEGGEQQRAAGCQAP